MATNFPGSLDSFTNPSGTDAMDSVTVPHATQHADLNDAVEALQAKVGVDGSAVTSSLDYKVANQGLTLVKSQTIGTAVSSVTVSDVFSSAYDNYRLLVHVGPTSAISGIKIQFGTTTGNLYYGSYAYALHTDTSTTNAPQSAVNYLYITDGDTYAYAESLADVTVYSPNIAQRTTITGMHYGRGYSGWQAGQVATLDQYTSFVLFPSTGTFATGGTIKVYGYNNG